MYNSLRTVTTCSIPCLHANLNLSRRELKVLVILKCVSRGEGEEEGTGRRGGAGPQDGDHRPSHASSQLSYHLPHGGDVCSDSGHFSGLRIPKPTHRMPSTLPLEKNVFLLPYIEGAICRTDFRW